MGLLLSISGQQLGFPQFPRGLGPEGECKGIAVCPFRRA